MIRPDRPGFSKREGIHGRLYFVADFYKILHLRWTEGRCVIGRLFDQQNCGYDEGDKP